MSTSVIRHTAWRCRPVAYLWSRSVNWRRAEVWTSEQSGLSSRGASLAATPPEPDGRRLTMGRLCGPGSVVGGQYWFRPRPAVPGVGDSPPVRSQSVDRDRLSSKSNSTLTLWRNEAARQIEQSGKILARNDAQVYTWRSEESGRFWNVLGAPLPSSAWSRMTSACWRGVITWVLTTSSAAAGRRWPWPWSWTTRWPCRVFVEELGHAEHASHAVDSQLYKPKSTTNVSNG